MNTLNISFSGSAEPQFDVSINATNSTTGSKALTIPAYEYMQIYSVGMELSFTGNSTRVTSFTIGYFVYAPKFTGTELQSMWSILTTHGSFSAIYNDWRLSTWHIKDDRLSELFYPSNWYIIYNYDPSKWTGWFHVAFTYEKNTNIIYAYIDGVWKGTFTASNPWISKGNSGGCVFS